MQNDVRQSRRHPYGPDSAGNDRDDRHGTETPPSGPGVSYRQDSTYFEPSPLFQPGQHRLNQFERSTGSPSSDEDERGARPTARAERRVRYTMPKGYKRPDERIRDDICESLSLSGTDVRDVSVEVSDGRVTLEGTVIDRYAKHEIEDHAAECLGVLEVDNRIRVRR